MPRALGRVFEKNFWCIRLLSFRVFDQKKAYQSASALRFIPPVSLGARFILLFSTFFDILRVFSRIFLHAATSPFPFCLLFSSRMMLFFGLNHDLDLVLCSISQISRIASAAATKDCAIVGGRNPCTRAKIRSSQRGTAVRQTQILLNLRRYRS